MMKISGFSMVKNADKLYYPIVQSIQSILPLVDEFVVAIGKGDEDDNTLKLVQAIDSPKLKIIETVWDIKKFPNGTENAHQTDIAKEACSGDWLFYLQADEVVHEQYLPVIQKRCESLLENKKVEGLLFRYKHFWGDYNHHHLSHGWYPHEIRIIRNDSEIHSWESAQSFRRIPNFDGKHYRGHEGSRKLNVAAVDAEIYHYGWVRPPVLMQNKKKALDTVHKGEDAANALYLKREQYFDYGDLSRVPEFKGTHPAVMKEWMAKFDWQDQLRYDSKLPLKRDRLKHEMPKYRFVTWMEQKILGGRQIGGFKNYNLLDV